MQQIINRLRRKGLIKSLVATSLFAVTLGLTPGLAGAQAAVVLGSQAKLVANGAAIRLPVSITCDTGSTSPNLSAEVTQKAGKSLAKGYAYTNAITCDGVSRNINLFIHAQPPGPAFKKGMAAASVNLSFCDASFNNCQTVTDSAAIKIVP